MKGSWTDYSADITDEAQGGESAFMSIVFEVWITDRGQQVSWWLA
jgi:hypothetical protein